MGWAEHLEATVDSPAQFKLPPCPHCEDAVDKHRRKRRTGYEDGAICSGMLKLGYARGPWDGSEGLGWDGNAATALKHFEGGPNGPSQAPLEISLLFLTPHALDKATQ